MRSRPRGLFDDSLVSRQRQGLRGRAATRCRSWMRASFPASDTRTSDLRPGPPRVSRQHRPALARRRGRDRSRVTAVVPVLGLSGNLPRKWGKLSHFFLGKPNPTRGAALLESCRNLREDSPPTKYTPICRFGLYTHAGDGDPLLSKWVPSSGQ